MKSLISSTSEPIYTRDLPELSRCPDPKHGGNSQNHQKPPQASQQSFPFNPKIPPSCSRDSCFQSPNSPFRPDLLHWKGIPINMADQRMVGLSQSLISLSPTEPYGPPSLDKPLCLQALAETEVEKAGDHLLSETGMLILYVIIRVLKK